MSVAAKLGASFAGPGGHAARELIAAREPFWNSCRMGLDSINERDTIACCVEYL